MNSNTLKQGIHVPAGKDRFKEDELMIWGLIPLSTKVSSKDTAGGVYIFEHTNMGKGGPPRHFHYEQDEWFYAIKGEFAIEVGEEKFRLKAGDSLFAPRMVPHAWAHISDQPGSLLTLVSPAGTFETFIRDTARLPRLPAPEEVEKAFAAHGMKVVGPPLKVD
jgi:mannose-6-phosphate isomerase-like protein (cupin superfamily)